MYHSLQPHFVVISPPKRKGLWAMWKRSADKSSKCQRSSARETKAQEHCAGASTCRSENAEQMLGAGQSKTIQESYLFCFWDFHIISISGELLLIDKVWLQWVYIKGSPPFRNSDRFFYLIASQNACISKLLIWCLESKDLRLWKLKPLKLRQKNYCIIKTLKTKR